MSNFWHTPIWYSALAAHTFISSFVPLRDEAIKILKTGGLDDLDEEQEIENKLLSELEEPMQEIMGNCFVSVDTCAPTDTVRFKEKKGAVYSAKSAWHFLKQSEKVRSAAQRGEVTSICVRPFRHMTEAREFRLFIKNRTLVGASQYHLIRHFRRLVGIEELIWKRCQIFTSSIAWRLPDEPIVMDIYFTAGLERIMIVDLNPWGEPTDPLLFDSWNSDAWGEPRLKLMAEPTKISGEINVSF